MKQLKQSLIVVCATLVMMVGTVAHAQWELDSQQSVVNFISIKNGAVAETHRFDDIVGVINDVGILRVAIDLDSVDTLIGIRNERMRELLFETAKFPAAELEAVVEPEVLAQVLGGGVVSLDVPVTLSLHGVEQTLVVPLLAAVEGKGSIRVMSARPVLLNAADFGLLEGISRLREIAGLQSIATAIPVTLNLLFLPSR